MFRRPFEEDLVELGSVIKELLLSVPQVTDNPNPEKQGGYLTVRVDGEDSLVCPMGKGVPEEKWNQYRKYSMEKALRLASHAHHSSSWQTRQPDINRYGGAIRVPRGQLITWDVIISFSGLPEQLDEALMLVAACKMKWMDVDQISAIASQNDNPFINNLYRLAFAKA